MEALSPKAQYALEQAKRKSISLLNPALSDLPSWVSEERLTEQAPYIRKILDAFQDTKVVVLDAPTGSGKTLIAEVTRRLLDVDTIYSCTTKALQDQVESDFMYASVMKGRANYPTLLYPDEATCDDCVATSDGDCYFCGVNTDCPYEIAKNEAFKNPFVVVNTAYLLAEGNSSKVPLCKRPFIVIDEADTLENEILRWYSVQISERRAKYLGLEPPKKVTVPASWEEWLDRSIPVLEGVRKRLPDTADVRNIRQRKSLTRLIGKLRGIRSEISSGWVYTGKDGRIEFKPVRVNTIARDNLWPLGGRFLLMSATTVSPQQLIDDLGGLPHRSVIMPSNFPVKNRPIMIRPTADMSRKVNDTKALTEKIGDICRMHERENVLVHTVSYKLTETVYDNLQEWSGVIPQGYVYTYRTTADKDATVWQFRRTGGVLIAPSLDRGIDLPDDLCRVIIIAKVPFPYLGDRQVSARLHSAGGQSWYNVQTVRSIVQMSGRGVRHKNDFARTYVLDSQFQSLWNKARGLFPQWWVEALDWRR